jgi:hypothetical protein
MILTLSSPHIIQSILQISCKSNRFFKIIVVSH